MAKTKPIGVRFDEDLLAVLREDGLADSPQKALNYLTEYYRKGQANTPESNKLKEAIDKSKLFEKKENVATNNNFLNDLRKKKLGF